MRQYRNYLLTDDEALADVDESRWSMEYKGRAIDVDFDEVEPDQWSINVSLRIVGWAEHLRFTDRESARVAGEQIGIRFIEELDHSETSGLDQDTAEDRIYITIPAKDPVATPDLIPSRTQADD